MPPFSAPLRHLLLLVGLAGASLATAQAQQNVGIGTSAPNGSAALDVTSTTKGLLPPRMTQTQRDAIASPAAGLTVYNTSTGKLNTWNGTSWTEALASTEPYLGAGTATFAFTGGVQTYTVPAGVTTLRIDARGAQGGSGSPGGIPNLGGNGARVQATLAVTPGQVLQVLVGGQGGFTFGGGPAAGGYNGGGSNTGNTGGAGGGATDLRTSGGTLANRLLVAAGGGGGGYGNPGTQGGAGGAPTGGNGSSTVGTGATQTAGGNAGGALGQGGSGTTGSGGGGYYGGGASGNPSFGGGGGSSWVTPTGGTVLSMTAGANPGNGSLTITPAPAPVFDASNFVNLPAPNLTGDISSVGTTTTYNNPVPNAKGGAGTLTGVLKASSGTVAAAVPGTDYLTPTGSAAGLINFPTLNQNTTGNAATVTTNANLTGDITSTGNATTYNNPVPNNKGGAGNLTGVLKATGGTVAVAVAGTDYAPAAGSGSYIQNGTSPQTGNFNVSGTGTVGGSITAATATVPGTTSLGGTSGTVSIGRTSGTNTITGTTTITGPVRLASLGAGQVTSAADGTLSVTPAPSGTNFIQNQTAQQTGSFNVSGTGTVAGTTSLGGTSGTVSIGRTGGTNTITGTTGITGATTITGNTAVTGNTTVSGNVGIGTTTPGSRLTVNGSFAAGYAAVTSTTYTVLDNDYYVVWTGNANGTFTLPAAAVLNKGRVYKFRNSTATFALVLAPSGGVLIDGQADFSVPAGQSVEVIANGNTSGTAWEVVGLVPVAATSSSSGASVGTIGGAGEACTPAPTASGLLVASVPATSQALDVTVNVTVPGTYAIGTNTVNGLSFFALGYLAATGVQTVPLYAHGTPINTGNFAYTVAYGSSLCTTTVSAVPGGTFDCAGATKSISPSGPLTTGTAYTGSYTLPYTAGTGLSYPAATITVSGLTLTRSAGTYAAGGGNVEYTLSGTYNGPTGGALSFNTAECGTIRFSTTFNCAGATQTINPRGPMTNGTAYTGSYIIPYTSGSGLSYPAATLTASGLTLTRSAGTYAAGGGTVVYTLSGTYNGPTGGALSFTTAECGTVSFINFDCGGATKTLSPDAPFINGTAYTGSYTVPYAAGNGLSYPATTLTAGGLTLTRTAGTYVAGGGTVVYTLSGTYTGPPGSQVFFTAECGPVRFGPSYNCAGATKSISPSGPLTTGTAYTGSYTLPYTAGSGLSYPAATLNASGLTLTRSAGTYAAGGGTVVYTLSGTYNGPTGGALSFTTAECGTIRFSTTFNCAGATQTISPRGPMTTGTAYTGSYTVPYTSGSGANYPAATLNASGLTLTRSAGNYAAGGGNVVYTLSGTYSGPTGGMVSFNTAECGTVSFIGIDCGGATKTLSPGPDTPFTNGTAYTGSYTLPYAAGNGQSYATTEVTVDGLTFRRTAGSYAAGGGTIVYTLSGTYTGTTGSQVSFNTAECGTILFSTSYNCAGATKSISPTGPLTTGTAYTGSYTVPYTAGNGLSYPATTLNASGLTLTRSAGTYAAGGGSVVYTLSGTYNGPTGAEVTFSTAECGTITFSGDAIRDALSSAGCTNCADYDAAGVNSWVEVTATEYAAILNISGMGAYGATASHMTATPTGANANITLTQDFTNQNKLPASTYPVAMSVKTHSTAPTTMAGIKLKTSTTSQTAGYADFPAAVGTPSVGTLAPNTVYYFVLKRPTTLSAASVSNMAVYAPLIHQMGLLFIGGSSYRAAGDSATPSTLHTATPLFQVLATPTKQW